jgi:maltooligosyltrehalose trehalohydrolase
VEDLRVWAPRATRVELVTDRRRALIPVDGGWHALGAPLAPGTDYRLSLDGSDPLPDQRSRWQPHGVHGPSRVDDPAAFRWTDAGWSPPALEDGIIYEMHVGTFTPAGTFDAAIEKLDALVDLGVTHLELLPVAEFAGERGWGYDGVGLYAPHHAYGGPEGLRRLVDACHARRIAVLLDVVYNHLGPEGNYLPRFGPYFSETTHTPWGPAMNLDAAVVRRYLLDNAAMWLRDFHVDGLRVDAVHALHDTSPTHLLLDLSRETTALSRALGRRLVLIAETNRHDPRVVAPREAGGHGFDAEWCDDLHHALHAALTGEREGWYESYGKLAHVAEALQRGFLEEPLPKRRGKKKPAPRPKVDAFPPASAHRFLGYAQNHDQVGNRAHGERLHHLVGEERARAAAALVLCGPFTPMLWQGEEWFASTSWLFFSDHGDPWLGPSVREGRWREFGEPWGHAPDDMPDPQCGTSLERSRLRWDERAAPAHARALAWYRALVRLRRERADLRDGDLSTVRVRFDEAGRWLTLARARTAVLLNLGPRAQELEAPGEMRLLLASREGAALRGRAVTVPAESAIIVGA